MFIALLEICIIIGDKNDITDEDFKSLFEDLKEQLPMFFSINTESDKPKVT